MDYKVIYSPNAISDLAEIVRFVAQDDPQTGSLIDFQRSDAVKTGHFDHRHGKHCRSGPEIWLLPVRVRRFPITSLE